MDGREQNSNGNPGTRTGLEIAVIGMSGRFPGAKNIREFWDNLKNGVDSISFFSEDEMEEAGIEAGMLENPNYVKARGVLEEAENFDYTFFEYTVREAEWMDPQFRIFHESAWKALEDAGYNPETYGGAIGLYVGTLANYRWVGNWWSRIENLSEQVMIGSLNDRDFFSTRVAYKMNLKGPAITLQTACSTSLVAIHLGCQSLLSGESDMVLAGGISIWYPGIGGYLYEPGMVRSTDGRTRAFDARANGTNGGDGAAIVVLKRLEDALKERDRIDAVIKGSALNNDGRRKVGYTAPSVEGQAEVIRAALQMAEVEAESIGFVEAHGTATALGDPVEIEALKRAFATDKRKYCALGSVKTNVGHLDAAAGTAGFIKAVLALKNRLIPPSLHYETPNPRIDFENSPFFVNKHPQEWTGKGNPLRAGVSSFGIGGTNAHVILEEAPPPGTGHTSSAIGKTTREREYRLILLSAKNQPALEKMTLNLSEYLKKNLSNPAKPGNPGPDLADVAYTLQVGRKAFKHRWMSVSRSRDGVQEVLNGIHRGSYTGISGRRSVVFMFPGQGAQYVNMGRELYETEPVFREETDRCFEILKPLLNLDIKEVLYPSTPSTQSNRSDPSNQSNRSDPSDQSDYSDKTGILIDQTQIAQPLLFVFEYALARQLMKWGIRPEAMIGHSIGEYVAACISGVMALEDAVEIVAIRGRSMQQMPPGAMMGVSIALEDLLPQLPGEVSLAAVNGPKHSVVSGTQDAIEKFSAQMKRKGNETRRLHTSHAFHSYMMDPVLEEYKREIEGRRFEKPRIPYISNLTGRWITPGEVSDPGYWAAHLRKPVQFDAGMTEILKEEEAVLVEVGPGNVLSTIVRQHPGKKPGHVVIQLVRHPKTGVSDQYFLLEKLGRLWLSGVEIDWEGYQEGEEPNRVSLPTYPFINGMKNQAQKTAKSPGHGVPGEETGRGRAAGKHEILEKKKEIAGWFYLPLWEETGIPKKKPAAARGEASMNWLVFSDRHGLGARITRELEREKHRVIIVKAGTGYEVNREGEITIDPGQEEHYRQLFADLDREGKKPQRILHLWGITGGDEGAAVPGKGQEGGILETGYYSLLNIARSIGNRGITGEIRLGVVVDQMQEVMGIEEICPHKAVLLGAVRAIPGEYPNLRCCCVDIMKTQPAAGRGWEEEIPGNILAEFNRPWENTDNIIAYRGKRRWERKVKPVPFEPIGENTPRLREKGVYLVTGGTGGIGLTIAVHLAKEVKSRLVLTTRSWFPAREEWNRWLSTRGENDSIGRKIKKLLEIHEWGGEVEVERADAADLGQMQEVVARMRERYGSINGVIHAAGVPDGALIQRRTRQMTEEVIAPKVRGTLVLEELLKGEPLDFFILCSSLSTELVTMGQPAYSGANAFLDAFARYKTAKDGTFCVSINWDAWQEVGMAVEAMKKDRRPGKPGQEEEGPARLQEEVKHPLYRYRVRKNAKETIYVGHIRVDNQWVLAEHRLLGKPTLPGTAWVEMARAAYEDRTKDSGVIIRELYFLTPLRMEEDEEREVHTILTGHESGEGYRFIIRSREREGGGRWEDHVVGELFPGETGGGRRHKIEEIKARCSSGEIIVTPEILNSWKEQDEMEFIFGPRWQNLKKLQIGENQVMVTLELPGEYAGDIGVYKLHPAMLDTAVGYYKKGEMRSEPGLPFSYGKITVIKPMPRKLYCYHRYKEGSEDGKIKKYNITIMDEEGWEVVVIEDYQRKAVTGDIKAKLSESEVYNPGEVEAETVLSRGIREERSIKHGILPVEGIEVFRRVMGGRAPQVVISTRDFAGMQEYYKALRQPGGAGEKEPGKTGQGSLQPRPAMEKAYEPPKGREEEIIAQIWQDFLGIEGIGRHDDFFELGGDSLKAMTIVHQISKALGIEISISDFFNNPTTAGISAGLAAPGKTGYTGIEPVEEKEYYELSSAQKRMYVLQQIEGNQISYNLPYVFLVEGVINIGKLEGVFKKLIHRHEVLRTSFAMIEGKPVQRVHEQVGFEIGRYGITNRGGVEGEIKRIIGEFTRPFELSRAPLLRGGVIELEKEKHIMMVDIHHIVTDGTSMGIFIREFGEIYAGSELTPKKNRYRDFTPWQDTEAVQEAISRQEKYWLKEMEEEIPPLDLPADNPRPAMQSFEGNSKSFDIDEEETRRLNEIVKGEGVTIFALLMAVYNVFLAKISGREEIAVGIPVSGRRHAEMEEIIGMFVNTLVLRSSPIGEKRFTAYLAEVKKKVWEALENQDYPFEQLVKKLNLERDVSRNPLFDVMFLVREVTGAPVEMTTDEGETLKISNYRYTGRISQFDMTLIANEGGKRLEFTIEYCSKLFKEETIERYIEVFKRVIAALAGEPGKKISQLEIISEAEKQRILKEINGTAAGYPGEKTIYRLYEEQEERTPDRIALVSDRFNRSHRSNRSYIDITYRELKERSGRLAERLIEKGVRPDTIVGIMIERTLEMVIGIFGIMEAGGAYMPIDPGNPRERIDYMEKDSGAVIVMTAPAIEEAINRSHMSYRSYRSYPSPGNLPQIPADALAYVIYTSGTTGRPKGVMINHRSLVNRLNWMQKTYNLEERDTVLQKTTYTFDVSVWEIFWWSFTGAKLCLLTPGGEKDPGEIIEAVEKNRVTVMHFVPSMMAVFLEYLEENRAAGRITSLRQVIASGEALIPAQVERFNRVLNKTKGVRLDNLYGPTEATVDVTYYPCTAEEKLGSIPIGKPIDNIKLWILDKYDGMQPLGAAGELNISGVGLARGYMNRPGLTAEKFLRPNKSERSNQSDRSDSNHSPLIALHSPLYRTGDLARWHADGNIEFLGRIDYQVKIRGYRIELGEIENRMRSHPGIKGAVVLEKTDEYRNSCLSAYFVADREIPGVEMREYLAKSLPEYMIPGYFTRMETIPLTPSGKADRKALPDPGQQMTGNIIAPRDDIEAKLVEIWAGVLPMEKEKISITGNFFRMGGHSLKAAVMIAKIHKEFQVKLPLARIFKTPDIGRLSAAIKELKRERYKSIEPVEKKEYYELSSAQKRLYFVQQMNPGSTAYNMPEVIPLPGGFEITKVGETFKKLIKRHESLRTSFHMVKDTPVQKIHEHVEFEIEYDRTLVGGQGSLVDGQGSGEVPSPNKVEKIIGNFTRPFDLSCAPLLRVGLIKEEDRKHILMVDMHHIISDAVSEVKLVEDFETLYSGKEIPALRIQYKDFSQWQTGKSEKEANKKQEQYWLKRLAGEIPLLELPTDKPRPGTREYEGSHTVFNITGEESRALKNIAHEEGATLFMVLMAAASIFFSKLSGQEEIIIGTPVAGRTHADLEPVIGMFVNTLAMRNSPAREKTFEEFLTQLKELTVQDFENQDYPFEELVEKLAIKREPNRNPLFDVMFSLQNAAAGERGPGLPGGGSTPGPGSNILANRTSKFDMSIDVEEREELLCIMEYDTQLFKKESIDRFIIYFKEIVSALVKNKQVKIGEIAVSTGFVDIESNPDGQEEGDFKF